MISTHSQRLERWLGKTEVENISRSMRGFYGPPIPLAGVPGEVLVCGDGDFVGKIRGGVETSVLCYARDLMHRLRRAARIASRPSKRLILNTGFASIADLLSEAKGGKRQEIPWSSSAIVAAATQPLSVWTKMVLPSGAGLIGSAAPGGRAPTRATTGAFNQNNADSSLSDRLFLYDSIFNTNSGGTVADTLLLYDRIFDVAKTMSSSATEAVSGVPTRYQNTSVNNPDYVGGNFVFPEATAALGATAHNWTVCQYTNQAGTTGQSIPSIAGQASLGTPNIDLPLGINNWFMPLAAGDTGIKALTQMQCSASVTGSLDFVMGHPLAWLPTLSTLTCNIGGLTTAFNLVRIFDDAALACLILPQGGGTLTNAGSVTLVSG